MDWKKRIERARKKGEFSIVDMDKSEQFTTCAVGERFGSLDKVPQRIHEKIYDLGIAFYRAVESDKINYAEKVYNKINRFKK